MASDVLSEAVKVLEALKGFSVEAVERLEVGGLELVVADLGVIGGRRVALAIMPPRTKINFKNARRAYAAALHVAEESASRGPATGVLAILYSRGGSVTKLAYLYLGLTGSREGGEVVIVNGPPSEIAEVLKYLKAYRRVLVRENRVYPAKIF